MGVAWSQVLQVFLHLLYLSLLGVNDEVRELQCLGVLAIPQLFLCHHDGTLMVGNHRCEELLVKIGTGCLLELGHHLLLGHAVHVHASVIHACTIEDACLIGIHATILDGAVVRRHSMIGAGALVSPGKVVGEGELWLGNPARFVRKLSERELEQLRYSAQHYMRLKDAYIGMAAG